MEDNSIKLSQTQKIVLMLMEKGDTGLLTADIFRSLRCAKYTSRLSELRTQGHHIEAEKVKALAGGLPTEQWKYVYAGYTGKPERLSQVVAEGLERWLAAQHKEPRQEELPL